MSCSTQPVREQSSDALEQRFDIGFIQDGMTTREEVVDRLGAPFHSFDDGRLYAYFLTGRSGETEALTRSACANMRTVGYCRTRHQLVLVFDEAGTVSRHAYLVARNET